MSKVIITGGTGLIGTSLCKMLLARNDDVIILTTQMTLKSKSPLVQYVFWNPEEKIIDPAFRIDDCIIINLAGAGVSDKRWNDERKKIILNSRVSSLQTLYSAVESGQIKTKQLISASAIGYYAESEKLLSEPASPDNGFLSSTCTKWEQEALTFSNLQLSVSIVRIGIVLSKEGGALKEFSGPLKYGVAAIPCNGSQMISWIHIEDMCRLLIHLMDSKTDEVYNAVADNPVSLNNLFEVMLKIEKGVHLKIHIPFFLLKIILGEMAAEIMKSALVSNRKILASGFDFKYKTIDEALTDLLNG